jgi:hypothetical protein
LTTAIGTVAVALLCTAVARAQDRVQLLDVPYLPQSEALCGGAAAAMVMRYWTGAVVYPDAFSDLVRNESGGIRGDDLVQSLRDRGWQAISFTGDIETLAGHLARGRPVITLIEDRPNRFHYVVVLGLLNGRIVAHDPARAPFRVFDRNTFLGAWSRSGHWSMLALPAGNARPTSAEERVELVTKDAASASTTQCQTMVAEGVRLARAGEVEQARGLLGLSARLCPRDAAPLRELAGVHALREQWREAAGYAEQALALDANDTHAARTLGVSRFLQDDPDRALDAWNRIGEPVVDLVNVAGLQRIRYEVATRLMGLEARELLSADKLVHARRRLSELPAATGSRVSYVPTEDGRANVEAAIVERPMLPAGVVPLAALAVRSVVDREIAATVATPSGGGETLTAGWRWWEKRPRVSFSFETPSPSLRAGSVWRVEGFYERQPYSSDREFEETWRGARFSVADWVTRTWRVEIGVGVDRWDHLGTTGSIAAGLQRRSQDEKWIVSTSGALYEGALRTGVLSGGFHWRSSTRSTGTVLLARGGLDVAGAGAPLGLWGRAGTEPGRRAFLRAHPFLDDGIVSEAVMGRTLAHGGAEWRYWVQPGARPFRVAPVLFLDVARATRTQAGFDRRFHVDAGIGLRLGVLGAGTLRIDLGKGLRDGATAVSVGWEL